MAKSPPERLAAALKANLKRRKQLPSSVPGPDLAKNPEESGENAPDPVHQPQPET
ncbi:MAG TPA: hypothetical protein VGI89_09865 [Rhizomicrobium sp.]